MYSPRRRDNRQGPISPRLRSRDRRGDSRVSAYDEEERRVRRRSRSRSPRERARSNPRSTYRRRSRSRSPRESRESRESERRRSRSRSSPNNRRPSSPERSASRKNSRIRSPPKTNYRDNKDNKDNNNDNNNNNKERDFGESSRQSPDGASRSSEEKDEEPTEVIKPNFGLSGKLAAESNKFNGVALKYQEPPEARKPTKRWRLYVFKKEEQIDCLHIHRQSAYLLGRDRKVADIPIDHPSCSSQHAVLQFRQVTFTDLETGEQKTDVKPYIIDLESSNSTFVNKKAIPTSRYVELRTYDGIKFGFSSRDYVLLHDELADTEDIPESKSE